MQGCIVRQADEHQELFISYRNEPKIEHRGHSPIHYGGAKMQISQETKTLEGSYWTDRATIGAMVFARVSRDIPSGFEQAGQMVAAATAAGH